MLDENKKCYCFVLFDRYFLGTTLHHSCIIPHETCDVYITYAIRKRYVYLVHIQACCTHNFTGYHAVDVPGVVKAPTRQSIGLPIALPGPGELGGGEARGPAQPPLTQAER